MESSVKEKLKLEKTIILKYGDSYYLFFIPGIWLLCTHILITHMNPKSATKSSPKFESASKNIGKCICHHHGLPNI